MVIEDNSLDRFALLPLPQRSGGARLFFSTLFVILGLFCYLLWSGHQTSRREALISANNLSEILATDIENALDRAQSDMRTLVAEITDVDLSNAPAPQRRIDFEALMNNHLRSFPAVQTYRIFTAQGQSVFGAGTINPQASFNVDDRAWFQKLRDDPSCDLVISEVLIGKLTPNQIMIMGIALRDGRGRFQGAVDAAINLGNFQELIDGLDIGPNGLIAVQRTDESRLVLRRPQLVEPLLETDIGNDLSYPILSHQTHGEGDFTSSKDRIARSYAFRTLNHYPLSVTVALAAEDYLMPWLRQSVIGGVALLAMVVILLALYRQSEREHALRQKIVDSIPGAFYLFDASGRFLMWNRNFESVLGMTGEEMRRSHPTNFFDDLDKPRIEAAIKRTFETGESTVEAALLTRDGRRIPYYFNGFLLEVDRQPALVGIGLDISEQKQTEARLQLAAGVFTHAREAIMITDAHGTIIDVNESFNRITGYSPWEIEGRNSLDLKSDRHPPQFYATMRLALFKNGHWSGEIWNRRKNGEDYAAMLTASAVRDSNGKTQNYVVLFSDITPMKEYQRHLEHIAHFDALTGLPNRVLLADRLQQAMVQMRRRKSSLAVAYLDLDGFKAVNDDLGHAVGDELLSAISQRMKTALREGDTLARIGGDEFVVLLVDLEQPSDWQTVLVRLLQAAADPVTVSDSVLQISASIGVTLFPGDGETADLLLRRADRAMYLAKQAGKNRYHLFTGENGET
jgi:diguanylate cyclase (GGDEF)-like protein/PAS domain S-box-containing protein